ncbi:MAG: hypothetical protein MJ119_05560 [Lachnospiraceae bacterium]|nr:hypothetical protein [Lachnospiraceae bacterium]
MDGNDVKVTKASTLEETDRKCPKCGGVMDFDPTTGKMLCPFCDYSEEIAVNNNAPLSAVEMDLESADKTANCNWGAEKKTIICKSCGAETIYDALEVANECPYCGSNQVMPANDENTMAPGGVVPFAITDEQASANFKNWIGKKFFCPKLAKESARPDSFKGIYLPYWTFDAQTDSKYEAQYGVERQVKTKDHVQTVIDWYPSKGSFSKFFDDELVIGTNQHDTQMLKCIEPFNTADNKAYKPEYVAGFAAERYSIGVKDAWQTAKKSISNKILGGISEKVRKKENSNMVRVKDVQTEFSALTYKYLLLPIWCSSFRYNNKVYQFVVNGQTGKVYGRTPVSTIKVIIVILCVLLVLGIIFFMMNN